MPRTNVLPFPSGVARPSVSHRKGVITVILALGSAHPRAPAITVRPKASRLMARLSPLPSASLAERQPSMRPLPSPSRSVRLFKEYGWLDLTNRMESSLQPISSEAVKSIPYASLAPTGTIFHGRDVNLYQV